MTVKHFLQYSCNVCGTEKPSKEANPVFRSKEEEENLPGDWMRLGGCGRGPAHLCPDCVQKVLDQSMVKCTVEDE